MIRRRFRQKAGLQRGDGESPGPEFRLQAVPRSDVHRGARVDHRALLQPVRFTRLCLQALFRHTRPAWELIVVDNGSTDDTAAYLAGVQDATAVPVTVITNPRNVGFPAAINQGLQAASGEYLVLLNNDAVVTDGWLDQLIALTRARSMPRGAPRKTAAEERGVSESREQRDRRRRRGSPRQASPAAHSSRIGLVGPMSNYASPPQLVEDVPYRDLDEMHAFAGRWRDEHRGQVVHRAQAVGVLPADDPGRLSTPSAGWTNGSAWGSSTMTTWPSGRVGPGSSWPWPTTCSSTTSAAGRSPATGSMPRPCWRRTSGGSPTSGATRCPEAGGSPCGRGLGRRICSQRRKGRRQRVERRGQSGTSRMIARPISRLRVPRVCVSARNASGRSGSA